MTPLRIIALILGLSGFVLLWVMAGYLSALAVFLMLWGNNCQMYDARH